MTIGKLSDEVLLEIFRYYLDASPWSWSRLVHIFRKWRRLVFSNQQSLQLRLFCTHGTPVEKTLDCWPRSLPIVVAYGGSPGLDPPAPEDENDIMAALNQTDRVHSISLTITSSLLRSLSAIKRPFSKLEDLILLSRDGAQLKLPSSFQWGQHLRLLHSTGIVIPALIRSHYSSIMDLQLQDVPNPWHFPPNELPDALFRMAKLQSLSLHFLPTSDHVAVSLPTCDRVVLPALIRLKYEGITRDLKILMARIDAPRLEDIEVTFPNEFIPDLSNFIAFIDRIEMHKSHRQAHILSSENAISISLIQPGAPTRIKFRSLRETLYLRLFYMVRIFSQFSALRLDVEDLHIDVTRQSRQEGSSYIAQWLHLLNLFGGVKWLRLVGNLSTDIVRLLDTAALPALRCLYIPQPGPCHVPLREVVVSFMTFRRLSGHPIAVEYERLSQIGELSGAGTKYAQCCRHCSLTRLQ